MQFKNGIKLGAPAAVACIMVMTLIVLLVRSIGLYPGVLGDEYTYSSMARLMPLSAAYIPDYLYLAIYKSTNLCGRGFMECSKLFNTVFFVAAAPFIYMTARRFCGSRLSVLIVFLSMLGPINSYTAYFMPEPLFFLSFWVGISYFLSLNAQSSLKEWALFGFIMGCSSLVKPHAMFMIPAFCLCIIFFAYKSMSTWLVTGLKSSAVFVVVMLATKFVVSFIIAGTSGLTLFGNFYTSTFESSASSLQRYLDIFSTAPRIIEGHLLAIVMMFGTSVAIIIFGSIKALAKKSISSEDKVVFCTLALLLNLIVIVGLFSASVAGTNVVETAFRLHMRYYDFMLPLLFIAAATQINAVHTASLKYCRFIIAILLLAMIGYAAMTLMHPFTPSYVDSAELRGYTLNVNWFIALAVFSALAVVVWCLSASSGTIVFLLFYLPLSVGVTAVHSNAEVRQRMVIDAYDRAGLFAKSYVPANELSSLVVVGNSVAATLRSLVYIDDLGASRDLSFVEGVPYTAAQTPSDKKWILAVGDIEFAKDEFEVMRFNGFSLAKKMTNVYPLNINFRHSSLPDTVIKASGLSHPESWGAWSDRGDIVFRFAKPLPSKFQLVLTAKAFGPNVDKPFEVLVGHRSYPVKLTADNASYTLDIVNVDSADVLTIKVPLPTSPKQLGMSKDDRTLGIGLDQLEIRKVE
ncbi:ArnT family glycosyltransferase [Pseudomonas syringae]|nr:glycosyltransferase family 39 protein [Pseudomonas syringae]KFF85325.1 phosphoglycerol transferase [Pseudomonas syringae pv. syringae]MBI6670939.1 glycosyltransferase family 39 protein [Pseudomonas syringae]MBS7470079.1 glycosyltransferase family 39 protein [Pseudomonas syringae]MDP5164409.1 glycosyltransferase family 39 protein [Pseudomonas syringae pv. aptata str. DSM 50252]NAO52568.1 phosphoglycerol transferase [Pseudomonas syringae]